VRMRSQMRTRSGTVLVVDDDGPFRYLVTSLLERAGYATVQAGTGEEALQEARRDAPALVVLDVRLPGLSGYEVCRQLKDAYGGDLPVIFVSGERSEPFDRAAGLLLGGDDYLVKPVNGDEFLARVRRYASPSEHPDRDANGSDLTRREREVLGLLAEGLTQRQIAHSLSITQKTVSTHIQHVLAKLGVHSRAQAVAVAHQLGLAKTSP
jgi:DNA-binding NarL/FixJ family response regulator